MKKITALLSVLLSTHAFAEQYPGQQLLSYFAANCKSQGEWTRSALADSTALIESLRKMSEDPDCKTVAGAVAQLGMLNQQLVSLEKMNSTKSRVAEINAKEQELMTHLSRTSDPGTIHEINKALRDLQVSRAGLIGKDKSERDLMGKDKAEAMMDLIQLANTTYAQVTSNQKCLERNPGILKTATSVVAAVGATAAVVNPALGLGLTAGATFMGETIEGVRRYTSARTIRKIADNTLAFEAYKCAMETMAERWCQMRDAEAFLLFKASNRGKPVLDSTLGTAIRLNDREIPVLLEWLNKIRSGVTPTTTSDAGRQNAVFTRETMVRAYEASGMGLIEENRALFQNTTNLDDRWNIIRSLITSLVPAGESPVKNPLGDVIPLGYAPYFLLGLPDDENIRNSLGYIPFNTWKKPAGFNPTLDQVKERYIDWIGRARTRVNQELTQVLQPDTLQTLSSAFDRTGNRWKLSPMDSLKNIISFLEMYAPGESDYAFRRLYADTLSKLKAIYEITQDAVLRNELRDNSPVEQIYEISQLKYGTVVIQTRLDMIVRLSLLELLERTSPEDQVVVAQLLAAERYTETISRMSGTDNLALIRADINRAQPVTIANMNSFISVFGNNINRILFNLVREENSSTGTVARTKRYARTELCFLLLSVPNVESWIDVRNCSGLKLEAVIPGGPESITLGPETFGRDLNDRACVYREFFRKSKIYENWGVK